MPRGSGRRWPNRGRAEEPEGLGAVLDSITGGRPWSAGMALGVLGRQWGAVVGERLAMETVPVALEGGVLVVRASSAGWGAQIRFLEGQVRDRINEALGAQVVREVRVTVGGV